MRRIERAAIKIPNVEIVSLAPPARHADILRAIGRKRRDTEQGFICSEGKFLSRKEAWDIAEAAGQLKPHLTGVRGHILFTEDLW